MFRARLIALTAVVLLPLGVLSACTTVGFSGAGAPAESAAVADGTDLLATLGLEGSTGREVVETLDRSDAERPLLVGASVRYDEVLLSDGVTEQSLPIEGDDFYLSLAPYETSTHDCYYHNLSTCRGELSGEDVHVTITADDGEVLVDEDATTYANGFVGFWVPRDLTGTIVVTQDGRTAQSAFSSGSDGGTCVTTLKLT